MMSEFAYIQKRVIVIILIIFITSITIIIVTIILTVIKFGYYISSSLQSSTLSLLTISNMTMITGINWYRIKSKLH
jgi:hypothetical protein